jgi:hypothetical protein
MAVNTNVIFKEKQMIKFPRRRKSLLRVTPNALSEPENTAIILDGVTMISIRLVLEDDLIITRRTRSY